MPLQQESKGPAALRSSFSESGIMLLATCALLLAGCGKQYGTVPVRGKVTFNGGQLPAAGSVYFTPIETFGGHPLRPAAADFGRDGSYSVSAFANVEGLYPGKYEAHLHCWDIPPTMDGPPPRSYLPAKYCKANTSGLILTVEEGSSAKEFNIDVQGTR
jgi:hypothetical protein